MVIQEKTGHNLESVATKKSLPESLYVPFKTVVFCYYDSMTVNITMVVIF